MSAWFDIPSRRFVRYCHGSLRETMAAGRSTGLFFDGEGEEGTMKVELSRVWGIVGALSMVLTDVGCVAIEAGHEGVLVEQPFFFGHGGVDPVPSKTGRVVVAP